ncbi:hypothetical protein SAMN04490248_1801, partial [Salinihabitans flavidus]
EAGAIRKGWTSMSDDQWDLLEAERAAPAAGSQPDLFDGQVPVVSAPEPKPRRSARKKSLSEVLNG